jgi:hypothetical protein
MKRTIILPALVTAFVALSPVGVALADNPHAPGTTGQPNKEEDPATSPPGHSSPGFTNVAEQHYAGQPGTPTDPGDPNTRANGHAVSQYDVAGFQWCLHHGGTSCT